MVPPHQTPTFAEARVLLLLIAGESPQQAASNLGVAISTVRSHIRHLHTKAGTHSLPALIHWGTRSTGRTALQLAVAADPRWSQAAIEVLPP